MHKYRLLSVLIILILALVACDSGDDSDNDDGNVNKQVSITTLKVSGSGTVVGLLRGLEANFEADTPGYDLDILSGSGTGGGVQGVTDDILDVAAMARPPTDSELEAAPTFVYVELGRAGIAIMTHPNVGIAELTSEQVNDILFGNITNWSEVGGPDERIVVFVRDEEETATGVLRDTIIGVTPFPETAIVLTSSGDMNRSVAESDYSIGFGTWPSVLGSGLDITGIAVDGITPTDPDYPMVTTLGIGYLEANSTEVQPLVDWLQSDAGRTTLETLGVISTQ